MTVLTGFHCNQRRNRGERGEGKKRGSKKMRPWVRSCREVYSAIIPRSNFELGYYVTKLFFAVCSISWGCLPLVSLWSRFFPTGNKFSFWVNLPETLCYPTPVCVSGAGFVWDNKAGILHKTSNAMSPLSSAEPYLCHREAWGEGRKMRAVKSVCEETTGSQIGSWLWGSQDDVWDPGFKTGMGLGISK